MGYTFHIEDGAANYGELLPLYEAHFAETQDRLERMGLPRAQFQMRVDQYMAAWNGDWLINYVVRHDGKAVGVSNVYLTTDMHSAADIIAVEDSIYVMPEHRNGLGKQLVKYILADLPGRGVKRVLIDAVTDLRVSKIWRRMGFKDHSERLVYHFPENS